MHGGASENRGCNSGVEGARGYPTSPLFTKGHPSNLRPKKPTRPKKPSPLPDTLPHKNPQMLQQKRSTNVFSLQALGSWLVRCDYSPQQHISPASPMEHCSLYSETVCQLRHCPLGWALNPQEFPTPMFSRKKMSFSTNSGTHAHPPPCS